MAESHAISSKCIRFRIRIEIRSHREGWQGQAPHFKSFTLLEVHLEVRKFLSFQLYFVHVVMESTLEPRIILAIDYGTTFTGMPELRIRGVNIWLTSE